MPTICKVFLIRHGSTVLTAEDRFAGSTDVLLGVDGELQAVALGQRLSTKKLAAIYASPMIRTMKTADCIAKPHGIEIIPVPELREVDHGKWEGLTRKEVQEQYAKEYEAYESDPFTCEPPSGESGLAVLNRALPAFQRIVEKHPGETIAIVSHKATIRLLISYYLGFNMRMYRDTLDQQPCALNVLDFKLDPIHARLLLFNDTTHYDKECEHQKIHPRISKFYDK